MEECAAPLSVEVEFTIAGPSGLEEVNRAVADLFKAIEQMIKGMNH